MPLPSELVLAAIRLVYPVDRASHRILIDHRSEFQNDHACMLGWFPVSFLEASSISARIRYHCSVPQLGDAFVGALEVTLLKLVR